MIQDENCYNKFGASSYLIKKLNIFKYTCLYLLLVLANFRTAHVPFPEQYEVQIKAMTIHVYLPFRKWFYCNQHRKHAFRKVLFLFINSIPWPWDTVCEKRL